MKHATLSMVTLGLAAATLSTASAHAYAGSQYAPKARISIAQARNLAHKALPGGKIISEELEPEAGGSGLRYTFDVKVKGAVREIGIDAKTGKLLENSAEGADSD